MASPCNHITLFYKKTVSQYFLSEGILNIGDSSATVTCNIICAPTTSYLILPHRPRLDINKQWS